MMVRKIIRILLVFIFVICILAGAIFYISYKQEHTKTQIEPFGLSLGLRDVGYVKSHAISEEKLDTFHIPTPMISYRTYQALDPNGYCRQTFGERLVSSSKAYLLYEVPKPLSLPDPISNSAVYKVYVHPIVGVFGISAIINPKEPPNANTTDWQFIIHGIVKNEVLPTLKEKYPNLLVFLKSKFGRFPHRPINDFESYRTDEQGRTVNITLKLSLHGARGTSLNYGWHFMGIFDDEKDTSIKKFDGCEAELKPIYKIYEKERKTRDEQKQKHENEKRKIEEERKKTMKNNL